MNDRRLVFPKNSVIYRVTRKRKYGSGVSVKLCTKASVTLQIVAFKDAVKHEGRFGRHPGTDILKVERAEIGPFTDVTSDFLTS